MSGVRIDSLRLELRGVAPETASDAILGLDQELRRLLATREPGLGMDAPASLRLAPIETPARIDVAQLRALIADRLVELLAPRERARADSQDDDAYVAEEG